jgi:hypothetical protein
MQSPSPRTRTSSDRLQHANYPLESFQQKQLSEHRLLLSACDLFFFISMKV